jgi:hypothetical protein
MAVSSIARRVLFVWFGGFFFYLPSSNISILLGSLDISVNVGSLGDATGLAFDSSGGIDISVVGMAIVVWGLVDVVLILLRHGC